jgi:hypothetical protein
MKIRRGLVALVLALLVGLVPIAASAEGATVARVVFPGNGLLVFPLECKGTVVYVLLRDGELPFQEEDPFLMTGLDVITPSGNMIWNYKADSTLALVWMAEDLTDYCVGGIFDWWGFAMQMTGPDGGDLRAQALSGEVAVKWNGNATSRLYSDFLVLTGKQLTYWSSYLGMMRGGDWVVVRFDDHFVWR